jgi:flagellar hook-associated protein 3 FlgL
MRVTNQMLYSQITTGIDQSSEQMYKLNSEISSGKQINSPSDNPIGLSTVLAYRSELSANTQYQSNITYANGWLSQMDSSLQDVQNLLNNASQIAVQQSSSTATADTRASAANAVEQIRSEILSIANQTYNNKYLFSGTMTQNEPYLDVDAANLQDDVATMSSTPPASPADGDRYIDTANDATKDHILQYSSATSSWVDQGAPTEGTAVTVDDQNEMYVYTGGEWKTMYQGNDSGFSVQIAAGQSAQTNIPGSEIFSNSSGNIMASLLNLEKALTDNDQSGISAQLTGISDAGTVVSNALATVGGTVNRLDDTNKRLTSNSTDITASVSNIEDLDYAQGITDLTNEQTIYEATLKSASMITGLSLADFLSTT